MKELLILYAEYNQAANTVIICRNCLQMMTNLMPGSDLAAMSEELVETAGAVINEDLHIKKEKIRIYNGRVVDMTLWQFFLQHITHQIHHQRQISILLDELGIEHEIGNIFPLIPDA